MTLHGRFSDCSHTPIRDLKVHRWQQNWIDIPNYWCCVHCTKQTIIEPFYHIIKSEAMCTTFHTTEVIIGVVNERKSVCTIYEKLCVCIQLLHNEL